MTFRISNLAASSMVDAFAVLLDGGTIKARTGTQPATVDTAETGTLLVTMSYDADAAPGGTNGVAIINLPVSGTAVAAGDMGWARGYKSTGEAVFDGSITLTGNGGDLIATLLTLAIDDIAQLTLQQFTQPKE